jgi:hypothetical protein
MTAKHKIAWTSKTWNPVVGCGHNAHIDIAAIVARTGDMPRSVQAPAAMLEVRRSGAPGDRASIEGLCGSSPLKENRGAGTPQYD